MHRIDTPTAQIDKFGQGKNGFTNGDPSTGRRATDLNSDMWDAVQEEIANAIESTGITLDKSKHNQLYLAIQKAITDPGFLKKANNLSDLEDAAEARGNLQLGTAATKNVGVAGGNVMQVGAFGLGGGPIHRADAWSDIAQFYRINASSTNKPPITGNIAAGVVSLPCDSAPSTGYISVSGNGAAFIGSSNTPANGVRWSRIYTTDYKPTAQDTGAIPVTDKGVNVGQVMTVGARYPAVGNTTTALMSNYTPTLSAATGTQRPALEISNNGNDSAAAVLMLHREGNHAIYFGLDTDNALAIGGYSLAGTRYRIYHEGFIGDLSTRADAQSRANTAQGNAISWSDTNCARKPTGYIEANGWYRDATTGLMRQWGKFDASGGNRHVTFPTAFPSSCFAIQITVGSSNGVTATYFNDNTTGFDFALNGGGAAYSVSWEATGK